MARLLLMIAAVLALAIIAFAKPDKTVCYYGSWSTYREGEGAFPVNKIDPKKCTHLIYSFVGINGDGTIKVLDTWMDPTAMPKFNKLKKQNPKLKTLLAIGGWNEGSKTFSAVAANADLRRKFARNALDFIKKYGFDGFDLDWEYPAQRGGSPNDKKNVVLMLQDLRKTFDASGKKYLLTAAVAAGMGSVDTSYDVPNFQAPLDFINVMAYDFHGAFDGKTGHNSPLYNNDQLNVDASIKGWISRGAPANKLVLGMSTYGRSFTVSDPSKLGTNNGLGIPAYAGTPGQWTGEGGMLGYNEICVLKKQGGWADLWIDKQKVPAMYKGNQWVGYDNERSIKLKAEFAVAKKLGGVMIWSIETEDIYGHCGRRWPLLSTMNEVLYGTANVNGDPIVPDPPTTSPKPTTTTTRPPGTICWRDGYVRDPKDCNAFHWCTAGEVQYSFKCADGLAFNEKIIACDYPLNVPGCH